MCGSVLEKCYKEEEGLWRRQWNFRGDIWYVNNSKDKNNNRYIGGYDWSDTKLKIKQEKSIFSFVLSC